MAFFDKRSKVKFSICLALIVLFIGVLIAADIMSGIYSNMITQALCGQGTSFEGEDVKKSQALGAELCQKLESDSIVLLKNQEDDSGDTVLPLKPNERKVNLFGWGSQSLRHNGGGSGGGWGTGSAENLGDRFYPILRAFTEKGFEYNKELVDMYQSFYSSKAGVTTVYEPPISYYTPELMQSARSFSDIAIIVISRGGSENIEINGERYEIPPFQIKHGGLPTDYSRTMLETSVEEDDMIELVCSNFSKVIVVLNTVQFFAGFIDDERIDSALYVGFPGQNGTLGIMDVLTGKINPSGKTADTYIYKKEYDPTWANYIRSDPRDGDIQYVEDIYLGYKWYETAFADKVRLTVNDEQLDFSTEEEYKNVVQYPFGHGLSYTDFSWEVTDISLSAGSELTAKSEIDVTVTVTNTGSVAGKDVVQLYSAPEYIKGGIEKSAVNLVDFKKTALLEPGKSQDVKLSVSAYDLASYDCYDRNKNEFCGYELDGSKIALQLMRDAHTLAECENARIEYALPDGGIQIKRDPVTKKSIKNRMTGDEAYSGVPIDGSTVGAEKQYFSRNDFSGTFPRTRAQVSTEKAIVSRSNGYVNNSYDTDVMPTTGVDSDLRIVKLDNGENASLSQLNGGSLGGRTLVFDDELALRLGKNYNDYLWNTLLDQLTKDEIKKAVEFSGYKVEGIESVGKPKTLDNDGPSGINTNTQSPLAKTEWSSYPTECLIACSWDQELCFEFGLSVGYEASVTSVGGWYAPAVNLHRTPFNSRNYEYFGEDGVLSGLLGAEIVRGAKANGLTCYLKHLVLSEPGYNPGRLNTWITEQNLRENYLRPFEICVKEGGANAIMTAFNRVGGTWAGGSYPVNVSVLRSEWGFKGTLLTDWSTGGWYMNVQQGIRAGNDIWLNPKDTNDSPLDVNDPTDMSRGRNAVKNVLYTYCNTYYYSKTYDGAKDDRYAATIGVRNVVAPFRWWIIIVVAINVIGVGILATCSLKLFLPDLFKRKKAVAAADGIFEADYATAMSGEGINNMSSPDELETVPPDESAPIPTADDPPTATEQSAEELEAEKPRAEEVAKHAPVKTAKKRVSATKKNTESIKKLEKELAEVKDMLARLLDKDEKN